MLLLKLKHMYIYLALNVTEGLYMSVSMASGIPNNGIVSLVQLKNSTGLVLQDPWAT